MPKVQMLHQLAVEKTTNGGDAQGAGSRFKIPENLNNFGTIRFIAEEAVTNKLFVGAQVYFGSTYERMQIQGIDVMVMRPENVIATVTDEQST